MHKPSIEPLLFDMVKVRAWQILRRLRRHADARRTQEGKGETERRGYGVSVWHETPFCALWTIGIEETREAIAQWPW